MPESIALSHLETFFARALPTLLRRLHSRKGLNPRRHADVVDDLRQDLRLDCLENADVIEDLTPEQRQARWFRLVEHRHYQLRGRGLQRRHSGAALDDGVKGSDVSLHVISDRQGQDPRTFTSGERFKLELTCPPSLGPALRLFVFQGEQVFEPLPLSAPLACGNRVAWPGAFALVGSDAADVCISWSTKLALVTQRSDLGDDASCVRLATP